LVRLIENKRRSGVFLTVLGFGSGNLKDSTMELLANKGNGNYAYIDSLAEARKVLVKEAGATLVTVAKDVKLQVEFNPTLVHSYRLIGYENRALNKEDFNDDNKDAGEMGAGHTVTALYEVVPVGAPTPTKQAPGVDPLKYQSPPQLAGAANSGELVTVNVRYKQPNQDRSSKLSHVVDSGAKGFAEASRDHRFAATVAHFAQVLRGTPALQGKSLKDTQKLARLSLDSGAASDRQELLQLLQRAQSLN
jgi:Ca-activated chloride channel family protein